jgi:hypothetical protein
MDIINIGMITLESLSWSSVALAASILLVVYFVLTMVVRPYRDYLFYKKVLTANYKAKIMPFKVISKLYMDFMKGDYDKKGDMALTLKEEFRDYQVVLCNFKQTLFISLIDPQLLKEFFQKNIEGFYVKSFAFPFVSSFLPLLGNGLVFS